MKVQYNNKEHKVSTKLKTFEETDNDMEIRDIKPKYRIGDIFLEIGARSYLLWEIVDIEKIVDIEIGITEPLYTLKTKQTHMTIGEAALCERFFKKDS